jgi:hypothetical protein
MQQKKIFGLQPVFIISLNVSTKSSTPTKKKKKLAKNPTNFNDDEAF